MSVARKRAHHGVRYLGLGFRVVLFLALLALVRVVLRIHNDSLGDGSESSKEITFRVPKVAFLFLARSNLPLDFVWDTFFKNAESEKFSIYVHSKPGFVFDASTTKSTFFYDRQLKNSVKVIWGGSTMIEAERLLLKSALVDPANQRFVLLSDSCVPLYKFTYIYNYLMASRKSFVDIFLDKKEGRYNPKMASIITKQKWRKGSQWIALVRKHAEVVVSDKTVFRVFKKYCKRLLGTEFTRMHRIKAIFQMESGDCIPDEHYVQTLFSIKDLENEIEKRTITYTSWNQLEDSMDRKTWHPKTFSYDDASPDGIKEIKSIDHVNYEMEHRTEWCKCNSSEVPCFLFARKFSRGAGMRILFDGVVGAFDSGSMRLGF
ncbi:glycosyltransferase BC10-like isoform X1 [Carex rostrata]